MSPARLLLLALLSLPLVGQAAETSNSTNAPVKRRHGIMVDLKGHGIYNWDGDVVAGKSLCDAQCIILWPPIRAADGAKPYGDFSVVIRPDGSRQWAWRGKPLYHWVSDRRFGDANGDGVAGVWHVVKIAPQDNDLVPAFSTAER